MKLSRHPAQPHSTPVGLPAAGESVVLSVGGEGHIPARVLAADGDEMQIAITVPTRPFSAEQLARVVVEYPSARGRARLQGSVAEQSAAEPDLVRLVAPRSVEVLQEREFVRIRSARPVLVYGARNSPQVQSFTVDVSGGGLLLAGAGGLAVGDELSFRLTLTPGVTPVTGRGRVVRNDREGRSAVEFTSISDLDRRRLVRFIFECQRTELSRGLDGNDDRG